MNEACRAYGHNWTKWRKTPGKPDKQFKVCQHCGSRRGRTNPHMPTQGRGSFAWKARPTPSYTQYVALRQAQEALDRARAAAGPKALKRYHQWLREQANL